MSFLQISQRMLYFTSQDKQHKCGCHIVGFIPRFILAALFQKFMTKVSVFDTTNLQRNFLDQKCPPPPTHTHTLRSFPEIHINWRIQSPLTYGYIPSNLSDVRLLSFHLKKKWRNSSEDKNQKGNILLRKPMPANWIRPYLEIWSKICKCAAAPEKPLSR